MSPPSLFLEERPDPLANPSRQGDGDPPALRPDRPWYATGVLLDAEDFQAEQLYHRSRLAAAMRNLGGCGTLTGLKVVWQPGRPASGTTPAREEEITVEPGVALDRCGRLIEVPRPACLRLRRWLTGPQEPSRPGTTATISSLVRTFTEGGNTREEIVADVFLRFVALPRGYTPALAAGPFDATDAVQPSRIRDSYKLELVPLPVTMNPGERLPRDPWAEVRKEGSIEERWKKLRDMILAGGPKQGQAGAAAGAGDGDGTTLQGRNEHQGGVNPTALFLARLRIPVATSDAGVITRPPSTVSVANELREFVLSTSALAALAGMPAPSTP
jgi:hypothetical protein